MRILAVDDDSYILELIPMIIAQLGAHEVALASSADEALTVIQGAADPFDCFLLDIQMPGMDGIDLCGRVRSMPAYAKAPIIMLTAMTEKPFIDRAFAAGATDYATKPFDLHELRARLRVADLLVKAIRSRTEDEHSADQDIAAQVEIGATTIADVPNVVSVMALGNYLAALSTSGLHSTQVFAIEVDGFAAVSAKASASDRSYALTEIADTIATVLKPHGYLMAYAEQGCFLCVSNSPSLHDPEYMESEMGSIFDDKLCVLDSGDPVDIDFAVGQPLQPGIVKTQGAAFLFDRAIARAQARANARRTSPRPPNICWIPDVG